MSTMEGHIVPLSGRKFIYLFIYYLFIYNMKLLRYIHKPASVRFRYVSVAMIFVACFESFWGLYMLNCHKPLDPVLNGLVLLSHQGYICCNKYNKNSVGYLLCI